MNLTISARVLVATALLVLGLCRLAQADVEAYAATANGNFGLLDLTTGVYTNIGSLGLTSPDTIYGMGFIGGALYGGNSNINGGSLYAINTAKGEASLVGALRSGTTSYDLVGGATENNATFVGVTSNASSTLFAALPKAPPNVSAARPLGFEGDGLVAADSSGSNIYLGGHNNNSSDTLYVLSGPFLNNLGTLGANAVSGVLSGSTLYTTDGENIYSYTVNPKSLSGILAVIPITGLGEDSVQSITLAVSEPSTRP